MLSPLFTADIGGNMGLLLGASIFSVIELAEFLVLVVQSLLVRARRRHQAPRPAEPGAQTHTKGPPPMEIITNGHVATYL